MSNLIAALIVTEEIAEEYCCQMCTYLVRYSVSIFHKRIQLSLLECYRPYTQGVLMLCYSPIGRPETQKENKS